MMYRHKQQLSFWRLVYRSLQCLIEQDWKGCVRNLEKTMSKRRQAVTLTTYLNYLFFWSTTKCIISHATVNQNKKAATNASVYIENEWSNIWSFRMLTKRITVSNAWQSIAMIFSFGWNGRDFSSSLEIFSQLAWSFSRKAWPFVFLVRTISFACWAFRFVFSSSSSSPALSTRINHSRGSNTALMIRWTFQREGTRERAREREGERKKETALHC